MYLLGWAVLGFGAVKSLAGAEPAAVLAQAFEKPGRKAGDERKVEVVDDKYHFCVESENSCSHRSSSCKRLELSEDKMYMTLPRITDGCTPPLIGNDHLLPWGHRLNCILFDCWLEIPSRGIKAKLLVTTSNHVLVNMADFVDDLELEGDVLAAKRSHEDEDTFGGKSDGALGTSASTESDAESVPEKRRRRRSRPQK